MDNINEVYFASGNARRTAIKRLLFLVTELKVYFFSENMFDDEYVIQEK